jgi:hypothetical protein
MAHELRPTRKSSKERNWPAAAEEEDTGKRGRAEILAYSRHRTGGARQYLRENGQHEDGGTLSGKATRKTGGVLLPKNSNREARRNKRHADGNGEEEHSSPRLDCGEEKTGTRRSRRRAFGRRLKTPKP